MRDLPLVDLRPLVTGTGADTVAAQLRHACQESGFFYVTGHGISEGLQEALEEASQQFFDLELALKQQIRMELAGRAWRGYFPVGGELTSGEPDLKEGIYFGNELDDNHPLVQARVPMHGANLFPAALPELRPLVLRYLDEITRLGHTLLQGIALSLGLDASYFHERYTADPLVLFRLFHYPPPRLGLEKSFGVGEHTDYGLLTLLKQDMTGGLEVKLRGTWVEAPPVPNTLICNVGDMLDRMTGGQYLSVPHRVRNVSGRSRLSFAAFFDPNFFAEVKPIEGLTHVRDNTTERWDGESVHQFSGTYGDYLLNKVGRVFPQLRQTL